MGANAVMMNAMMTRAAAWEHHHPKFPDGAGDGAEPLGGPVIVI